MKPSTMKLSNNGVETGFDILVFIGMFFITLEPALWAIGFLIMSDTFTGIWKVVSKGGWVAFQSRKLGRIVAKIILYPLSLLVAYNCEQVLAPSIPWIQVTMGILATVEIKSIFENMSSILGFDLWQRIKSAIWKEKKEDEGIN